MAQMWLGFRALFRRQNDGSYHMNDRIYNRRASRQETEGVHQLESAGNFSIAVRVEPGRTRWLLSDIEDYERNLQTCSHAHPNHTQEMALHPHNPGFASVNN
jgi:hypothetical protein